MNSGFWSDKTLATLMVMHRDPRIRGVEAVIALASMYCLAALLAFVQWKGASLGDVYLLGACLFIMPAAFEVALLLAGAFLGLRMLLGVGLGGAFLGVPVLAVTLMGLQFLGLVIPSVWRDRIDVESLDNKLPKRFGRFLRMLPVAGPCLLLLCLLDLRWRPKLRASLETYDDENFGVRHYLPWKNWSWTSSCTPLLSFRPKNIKQLQKAVREANKRGLRVRMVAGGHSWSSLSQTQEVLLHTERLTHIEMKLSDAENPRVIVESGITNRKLNLFLEKHGYALPSNVVLETVRLGGLVATGSHGSGWDSQTMSDYVHAIEMVMYDGSIRRFEQGVTEQDVMDAVRLSLGAFGVIWRLELNVKPTWNVLMVDEHVAIDEAIENIHKWVPEYDAFDLNFFPGNEHFWVKKVKRTEGEVGKRRRLSVLSLLDTAMKAESYRFLLALVKAFPRLTKYLGRMILHFGPHSKQEILPVVDGIHYERNVESVRLYNIEIAFALDENFDNFRRAWRDFVRINEAWNKRGKFPLNMVLNVRFIQNSQALIGPASDNQHTCYIEILSGHNTPDWQAFSGEVGAAWLKLPNAAPHWPKQWEHIPGVFEKIHRRYGERLYRFIEIQRELDPKGMFSNALLEKILRVTEVQVSEKKAA